MIQTDPSGFIRRPTKFDRRRLNRRTLANLAPAISQNRAREMVAASLGNKSKMERGKWSRQSVSALVKS
jgi:hypothetical protein